MIRVYFYDRQADGSKIERAYRIKGDFETIKTAIKGLGGKYVSESRSWSISRSMWHRLSTQFEYQEAITWQKIVKDSESLAKSARRPLEIEKW